MDDLDTNQSNETPEKEHLEEEEELNHTDKMVGILTEPGKTFDKIAKFPPKTIDWFLPMFLLLLFVIFSQLIIMSNEEIAFQAKQEQIEKIQQGFDEAVQKGSMTREQADQQMENIRSRMEKGGGSIGKVIQSVSILIVGFIMFFIIAGIYFIFARFIFKDQGSYNSALVAYGMTSYIGIIGVILMTMLSLVLGKWFKDISIASFVGSNTSTVTGFILSKLNVISIWIYAVLSIGLAKMFNSKSVVKYYVMVFGLWILWGLLILILGKSIPFLRFLA